MPVVVHVEDLTVRYNGTEALSGVSFTVAQGDYLGIVGPNGSGKTTLVRAILGLTESVRGAISLFGHPLGSFVGWRRIGYLPQRPSSLTRLFPATVAEVVSLGLVSAVRGVRSSRPAVREAVEHALALMDIGQIGRRLIGELSGGQQQRVLLARALVNKPELLILDEPSTALDPETRESFYGSIQRLNGAEGVTVMLITHDIGTIGQYASTLLYLDKRVIFHGTFDAFCHSDEMAEFFGEFSQHVICHKHDSTAISTDELR